MRIRGSLVASPLGTHRGTSYDLEVPHPLPLSTLMVNSHDSKVNQHEHHQYDEDLVVPRHLESLNTLQIISSICKYMRIQGSSVTSPFNTRRGTPCDPEVPHQLPLSTLRVNSREHNDSSQI